MRWQGINQLPIYVETMATHAGLLFEITLCTVCDHHLISSFAEHFTKHVTLCVLCKAQPNLKPRNSNSFGITCSLCVAMFPVSVVDGL